MMHKSLRTALRMSALGMIIPLSLYVTSWFAKQYLLPTQNNREAIPEAAAERFVAPRNGGRSRSLKAASETALEWKSQARVVPAGAVATSGLHNPKAERGNRGHRATVAIDR